MNHIDESIDITSTSIFRNEHVPKSEAVVLICKLVISQQRALNFLAGIGEKTESERHYILEKINSRMLSEEQEEEMKEKLNRNSATLNNITNRLDKLSECMIATSNIINKIREEIDQFYNHFRSIETLDQASQTDDDVLIISSETIAVSSETTKSEFDKEDKILKMHEQFNPNNTVEQVLESKERPGLTDPLVNSVKDSNSNYDKADDINLSETKNIESEEMNKLNENNKDMTEQLVNNVEEIKLDDSVKTEKIDGDKSSEIVDSSTLGENDREIVEDVSKEILNPTDSLKIEASESEKVGNGEMNETIIPEIHDKLEDNTAETNLSNEDTTQEINESKSVEKEEEETLNDMRDNLIPGIEHLVDNVTDESLTTSEEIINDESFENNKEDLLLDSSNEVVDEKNK